MRTVKFLDLNRLRTLKENFKAEFTPIIKNVQEKLHQRYCKQSKGPKTCASIRWELNCEKA